ncbi:hypothetical protein KS4_25270 [Poriferisphaera corsica]|uniref:Uncharacterized protein n=1 Tax=Poriferisphaera corsica TaxID=2528020 RepID=A0A517YW67_9BACT|nr:hypothetical protein KS4_25270 [Poriferisphaera corsica]
MVLVETGHIVCVFTGYIGAGCGRVNVAIEIIVTNVKFFQGHNNKVDSSIVIVSDR